MFSLLNEPDASTEHSPCATHVIVECQVCLVAQLLQSDEVRQHRQTVVVQQLHRGHHYPGRVEHADAEGAVGVVRSQTGGRSDIS